MPLALSLKDRSALEVAVDAALESRDFRESRRLLEELILAAPLESKYFERLSELQMQAGNVAEADLARRRYHQLIQIEDNTKLSPSVDRLTSLWAAKSDPEKVIQVAGYQFSGFRKSAFGHGSLEVACSHCGRALIKVCREPEDFGAFEEEANIFSILTEGGCVSASRLLGAGALEEDAFEGSSPARYQILSYNRADRGGFGFPDMVLSLLEQQALGIYNGALTIRNMRYDSEDKVLRFSNYETAERLSERERGLAPIDFIDWCSQKERARVAAGGAASFLLGSQSGHDWIWKNGRLNLRATQLFREVRLQRLGEFFSQSVDTSKTFSEMGSGWSQKAAALRQLGFSGACSVLDVGCGMGAGARVLSEMGCDVTGLDNDLQQIRAAAILSNIENQSGEFRPLDLDYDNPEGAWDVVLLMNSLHFFIDPERVAKRISELCKHRIYLECSLKGLAFIWMGRWYRAQENWAFETEADLKAGLGRWFPQFDWVGDSVPTDDGQRLYCLERRSGN